MEVRSNGTRGSGPASRRTDILVATSLLLAGFAIGYPVILGGYVSYLDNPVHLAEIFSLAHDGTSGWSDIGFCGLPLITLHSPLWFGGLALLARIGVPLYPIYAAILLMAFAAPSLALYSVLRRRWPVIPAALSAYLLLIQPPSIVGVGAAFGGMWPWFLCIAGVILFSDRMLRALENENPRDWVAAACLLGLIALTHHFALAVAVLVFLVVMASRIIARRITARSLRGALVMAIVAAASSCVYWVPIFLTSEHHLAEHYPLSPPHFLARLFLPTDLVGLRTAGGTWLRTDLLLTDTLPMLVLVAGALAAILKHRGLPKDQLARVGFWLVIIFTGLILAAHWLSVPILGPVPWRFIYVIRVGMALVLPALLIPRHRVEGHPRVLPKGVAIALMIFMVLSGLWWGTPLRRVHGQALRAEMADVEAVWGWLKHNRSDEWGRIYLQDTFYSMSREAGFHFSHVLALTAHHTGCLQVGTYYGMVPYPTNRWLKSEFGQLFGRSDLSVFELCDFMLRANAGVVVTTQVETARQLVSKGVFTSLFAAGRFAVLRRVAYTTAWTDPLTDHVRAGGHYRAPGDMELRIDSGRQDERVLVKVAWHPWWRVEEGKTITLEPEDNGLMVLSSIPRGRHHVRCRWRFPVGLIAVSAVGWLGMLGWAVFIIGAPRRARERRRQRHRRPRRR